MKINIWFIVSDHFATLRNAKDDSVSYSDLLVFWVLPGLCAALAYAEKLAFSDEIFSLAVTFFGIFIALLLNMQVAVFGIFQARRSKPCSVDKTEDEVEQDELRKKLTSELNASLSYLTLISTVALVVSFCAFVSKMNQVSLTTASVFFYTHFVLTLLMVLKRSQILFKKELA